MTVLARPNEFQDSQAIIFQNHCVCLGKLVPLFGPLFSFAFPHRGLHGRSRFSTAFQLDAQSAIIFCNSTIFGHASDMYLGRKPE